MRAIEPHARQPEPPTMTTQSQPQTWSYLPGHRNPIIACHSLPNLLPNPLSANNSITPSLASSIYASLNVSIAQYTNVFSVPSTHRSSSSFTARSRCSIVIANASGSPKYGSATKLLTSSEVSRRCKRLQVRESASRSGWLKK